MSKKIGGVFALVGLCALSVFLLNCGSSHSRPSGVLYALTEGSNGVGNNVSTFAVDLNSGNLSLVNSNASTCATANACGLPLDIVLDPAGSVAFVLNEGIPSTGVAPTIYAYAVNSDGSLGATPTTASATLTPGDTAVAMTRDAAGKFLFVIDQGSDPTTVNCAQPPSNLPTVQCASISVFAIQSGSTTLSAVPGSPFAVGRIPSALSSIAFTPPSGTSLPCANTTELLFVTFNSDPVLHNDNTLSAYCVDSSGTPMDLTPTSPYLTQPNPISVLAVNTNPVGQLTAGGVFVYVGNQGSAAGAVSVFQMCTVVSAVCSSQDITKLFPVGTQTSAGQNPIDMLVDPTNNFLYVLSEASNQVFGFRINTTAGTLTPLNTESTGLNPVSMALHASVNNTGQFLYTSNNGSSNISGFTLSITGGTMSNPFTVAAPAAPSGIAAR